MSEHQLITPRRNFLIRALGFTAAGATVAVPITTLADAKARVEHHRRELERALCDRYGEGVYTHFNLPEPGSIAFDQRQQRRYYDHPVLVFGRNCGGWID
jgi:hypothetical protein